MKRVILTVAEFLILCKVQAEVSFAYDQPDEYIEANAEKKDATDGLDEEMPELVLETEVFDELVDSVKDYLNEELAEDDPDVQVVEALLEKLQAVEESTEEVAAEIVEQQEEKVEEVAAEVTEQQEEGAAADDQPEQKQPE